MQRYPLSFYLFQALLLLWIFNAASGQTVYFHQDFEKATGLVNPQPDTGQFSHIILTAPQLSYHKFHKGYLELTRTMQDSVTGGLIRLLRATPFNPLPETLLIQMTMSVESVGQDAVNAVYFYSGENFDPVNNAFPGNGLMFSRFVLNFKDGKAFLKDPETQLLSEPIEGKRKFTVTWIMNNAAGNLQYHLPGSSKQCTLAPGNYDIWLDEQPVCQGSAAYPGNSAHSKAKLSNFEIRFRNGSGKIRLYDILIRDARIAEMSDTILAAPNPVPGRKFVLSAPAAAIRDLRIVSSAGKPVAFEAKPAAGKTEIALSENAAPGIYILSFTTKQKRRCLKMIML